MATRDPNQVKRTINSRLRAFQSAGKDADSALDSVLRMDTISDSMRAKIKDAKASGQSQQAFDDLLSASGNYAPPEVDTEIDTGPLGGVARFLGIENLGKGIGTRLAMLDPQHRRNLEMIGEENAQAAEDLRTGGVTGRQMAGGALNLGLALGGGALLSGGARNLAAKATGKVAGSARGLTPAALSKASVGKAAATGAGAGYIGDVASNLDEGK